MPYLKGEEKKIYEVRLAIIQKELNADLLLKKIPLKDYTEGLVYDYLEANKTQKPTTKSINLFKYGISDKKNADKWLKLQLYYAREFFDYDEFKSAYKLLKINLAANTTDVKEIQWLAGWTSLRHLKRTDLAIKHFSKFLSQATTPISIARGNYWLARALQAEQKYPESKQYYNKAKKHGHTYYGQLASIALGSDRIYLPADYQVKKPLDELINQDIHLKTINLLIEYNLNNIAVNYAKTYISINKNKDKIAAAVHLIAKNSINHHSVAVAKLASHKHVFMKNYLYPRPRINVEIPIDKALTYAVIRQESLFDQYAISNANALGLMQIWEPGACKVAEKIRMSCTIPNLTKSSDYNIKFGTNYLKYLLDERSGSYILALASYNADAKVVTKWTERFGNPTKTRYINNAIDWVELVPYAETRNYLQRVIENVQVYHSVINGDRKLGIKKYLLG